MVRLCMIIRVFKEPKNCIFSELNFAFGKMQTQNFSFAFKRQPGAFSRNLSYSEKLLQSQCDNVYNVKFELKVQGHEKMKVFIVKYHLYYNKKCNAKI